MQEMLIVAVMPIFGQLPYLKPQRGWASASCCNISALSHRVFWPGPVVLHRVLDAHNSADTRFAELMLCLNFLHWRARLSCRQSFLST